MDFITCLLHRSQIMLVLDVRKLDHKKTHLVELRTKCSTNLAIQPQKIMTYFVVRLSIEILAFEVSRYIEHWV